MKLSNYLNFWEGKLDPVSPNLVIEFGLPIDTSQFLELKGLPRDKALQTYLGLVFRIPLKQEDRVVVGSILSDNKRRFLDWDLYINPVSGELLRCSAELTEEERDDLPNLQFVNASLQVFLACLAIHLSDRPTIDQMTSELAQLKEQGDANTIQLRELSIQRSILVENQMNRIAELDPRALDFGAYWWEIYYP